ncbi:Voltage-dependent calcium channel type D subunit alpha-1 (DmCa1D) [Durusdinium trenchii]|uniref:Voltage-dependent calcium channel type D subunit alpha-1 (DmCa1D) n=1 Tax=Durusdinium trenchii TaxID=1381693 RepID=A0ABP0I2E0_9DINO
MGPSFEFAVCLLLVVNFMFMAWQLQVHGIGIGHSIGFLRFDQSPEELYPWADGLFWYSDIFFAAVFSLEILIRLVVIGRAFWCHILNWIDFLVVSASWIEFFAEALPFSPTLFLRMVRLGKLLRALRVIRLSRVLESLHLLLKCIVASLQIFFWSVVLLIIIQYCAGMTISYMLSDYMSDASRGSLQQRQEVFRYYGTFSKTALTMFEVLFANWAPACRVLVDNVSEWYSIAFILYRCCVGFAVLNVVNAVFVQSTMRVASVDEELVAAEKAKAQAAYTRRVNALFSEADTSGNGALDLEECRRLLDHPQLQLWLHMLELDTPDLVGLFHMLDDGKGEISLDDLQEGLKRMKGVAKSLDLNKLQHEGLQKEMLFTHSEAF